MRILLLTQVLPFPPDSGPKIKTWNTLKCLARDHEVTLISFVRGDQTAQVEKLRGLCREVHVAPMVRRRMVDAWALVRSLTSGVPWLMLRDDRKAMRELVDRVSCAQDFEIVHADQINMAQYALRVPTHRVLDAHNALWLLYERLATTTRGLAVRWLYGREAKLLRRYEGRMLLNFDAILCVSEPDRTALRQAMAGESRSGRRPDPVVIPIAVDTSELPARRTTGPSNHILHIGTMYWPPNVDAIRWFAEEVLPLIQARCPDAVLDIIGAQPPAAVRAYANDRHGINILGYVPNPGPYLDAAGVFIVPVLAGGGMRVKILTALAQALPVVTTKIGCEGIAAEPGKHLLVADTPQGFADATLRLLEDRRLAQQLGENGRELVRTRYDLPQLARHLQAAYGLASRGIR